MKPYIDLDCLRYTAHQGSGGWRPAACAAFRPASYEIHTDTVRYEISLRFELWKPASMCLDEIVAKRHDVVDGQLS